MDIRTKAKEGLNWFEKVLDKLPGFKGYFDRELRRDSDKLQREFIAGKLETAKSEMNEIIRNETRKKDLSLLTDFDILLKDIEKIISGIKYSDRGYSGFFDLIKIKEDTLDKIYEADIALLETIEVFSKETHLYLEDSIDHKKIQSLMKNLKNIEKELKIRDEILIGFDKD